MRAATFRELVTNPAIGEEVPAQFADRLRQLDEDSSTHRFLADHVSVDQNTKSDLIGIVITLRDPVLAADIANAWARAYEQHINKLYTSATSADVEAVRAQSVQSERDYQTAQGQLEAYLADNPMPRLQKRIDILQTQIDSYQTALQESEALVNSRELATRRQVLDGYYADLAILEKLLSDARLLQKQVLNGETSSSATFGDSRYGFLTVHFESNQSN
jgi:capsule polysaccharide export protein KpsE/RkpR